MRIVTILFASTVVMTSQSADNIKLFSTTVPYIKLVTTNSITDDKSQAKVSASVALRLNQTAAKATINQTNDKSMRQAYSKIIQHLLNTELNIVVIEAMNKCYKENEKLPFFLRFDPLTPKNPNVNIYYSCGKPNKKDLDALTVKAKKINPKKEKGRFPASMFKEYLSNPSNLRIFPTAP